MLAASLVNVVEVSSAFSVGGIIGTGERLTLLSSIVETLDFIHDMYKEFCQIRFDVKLKLPHPGDSCLGRGKEKIDGNFDSVCFALYVISLNGM